MTVDPFNITKYDRTDAELEELLLFCVSVPGHNAKTTAASLDRFLAGRGSKSPFQYIRQLASSPPFQKKGELLLVYGLRIAYRWRGLIRKLKEAGIGCATRVARSMWELAYSGLDLKTCYVDDLEKIHGVGMKTSRFFVLSSRKDVNDVAGIDRHILRFLKSLSYWVPDHTPSSRKEYLKLESIFLEHAKKSGKTVAEFDLELWKAGASKEARLP